MDSYMATLSGSEASDLMLRVSCLSQVLSPKSLAVHPCNLIRWEHGNWDLPLHTVSQALNPSMTWIPTWQHFLTVRLGTCVESWVEHKTKPNSQHKFHKYFRMKQSRSNLNDILTISNGILKAQKLGLRPLCWDLGLGTPREPIQPNLLAARTLKPISIRYIWREKGKKEEGRKRNLSGEELNSNVLWNPALLREDF